MHGTFNAGHTFISSLPSYKTATLSLSPNTKALETRPLGSNMGTKNEARVPMDINRLLLFFGLS